MQGQWKVITAGGEQIQYNGDSAHAIGNLKVEQNRVHFKYGNNHNAGIKIDGNNIEIGPFASTRMLCHIQPSEHVVTSAIGSAVSFKINGSNLTLYDKDQKVVAELTKA